MFLKLDHKLGYNEIIIKPGDEEERVFQSHLGHYEFMVIPLGLKNAPSTFQFLMNDIFKKLYLACFD